MGAPHPRDGRDPRSWSIVDEGHYLKNCETQRTKAILGDYTLKLGEGKQGGVVDFARYAWILTGTPMANDPVDIYTFLRFCNTEPQGNVMPLSRGLFQRRYFSTFKKTFGERNTPRPDLVAELRA
jgi:SNF2 family DNA or RNA helicase